MRRENRLSWRDVWRLMQDIFNRWLADNAMQWGAAISFYVILSLAPLLVLAVSIAGVVFSQDVVEARLLEEMEGLLGPDGADLIQTVIHRSGEPSAATAAALFGLVMLLIGASGVFVQLKYALDHLFGIQPRGDSVVTQWIRIRLMTFGMVLATGFLLLVSLIISTIVTAVTTYATETLPLGGWLVVPFDVLASLLVITLVFGLLYKFLPDVRLSWRDVWLGALIAALLFTVGRYLIGLYLGHAAVGSAYGAAGSLLVLLIWLYYSSQSFFLGAEFIQAWSVLRTGKPVQPSSHGERIPPRA